MKSIEDYDNGRWTDSASLSGALRRSAAASFVDYFGNVVAEVMTDEEGLESGRKLPCRNVRRPTGPGTITGNVCRKDTAKSRTPVGSIEQGNRIGDFRGASVTAS